MGKPCVILLEIDASGALVPPQAGRAEPDSHVAFVITNGHATETFTVTVDLANTVAKVDRATKRNPFKKTHRTKEVAPDEIDVIQQKLKPATAFGTTGLLLPY